jgi:hypothetical protein
MAQTAKYPVVGTPAAGEKMVDVRVMGANYQTNSEVYLRGDIITVPESWIEKGITRMHKGVISDQQLMRIEEYTVSRAVSEQPPAKSHANEGERARREALKKQNEERDAINRKLDIESLERTKAAIASGAPR